MDGYRPIFLTLTVLLSLASCEVVKIQKCLLAKEMQGKCQIHEVRIEPCPEAAESKPCQIKLGSNATLSFDYTPTWSATKPGSLAYKAGGFMDIGFEQMNSDGCLYTTCPIEANKQQKYTYTLQIDKQFPAGVHECKIKLWNEDDYHQQCCLKTNIHLVN